MEFELKIRGVKGSKDLDQLVCVSKGLADLFPSRVLYNIEEVLTQSDFVALISAEEAATVGAAGVWRKNNQEYKFIGGIDALRELFSNTIGGSKCIRLFIAGDRSQVGKSTISLGILATLVDVLGYNPKDLAYIKPVTQCEAPQLVSKFCQAKGIRHCGIGPVVFYSGFTREFLNGNTLSSEEMMSEIQTVCDEYASTSKILLVDGVGYPAVGSICNLSNAQVAQASRAPVVLVGKKGVGDAVDSFNLNATFLESFQVRVLGGIFNRLPLDGYYNLENCRKYVTEYFQQQKPHQMPYGFLSELECEMSSAETGLSESEVEFIKRLTQEFKSHIDIERMLDDASGHAPSKRQLIVKTSSSSAKKVKTRAETEALSRLEGNEKKSGG